MITDVLHSIVLWQLLPLWACIYNFLHAHVYGHLVLSLYFTKLDNGTAGPKWVGDVILSVICCCSLHLFWEKQPKNESYTHCVSLQLAKNTALFLLLQCFFFVHNSSLFVSKTLVVFCCLINGHFAPLIMLLVNLPVPQTAYGFVSLNMNQMLEVSRAWERNKDINILKQWNGIKWRYWQVITLLTCLACRWTLPSI